MKKFYILAIIIAIAAYYFLRATEVTIAKPYRGQSVQAVFATGTVEAKVMYPLAAKSMGKLIELNVDEGSKVTKDQTLAKLEDLKLLNSIEELEAREKYLIEENGRQKRLYESRAVAKDLVEKSRSELDAARAAVKGAKSQLDDLSLKALSNATIIRRDGEIGQIIPANQAIFWLAEDGPLRITAEVDEEDISKITPEQKVLIRSDAFGTKVFNGVVDSITPKGDPIARSYRVRINFSQEVPFLIGMTTENNIILSDENNALLIPSSTIKDDHVWTVVDNKLQKKKIEIGAKDLKQTQVLAGVTENDVLVVEPKDKFVVGQRVRIKE